MNAAARPKMKKHLLKDQQVFFKTNKAVKKWIQTKAEKTNRSTSSFIHHHFENLMIEEKLKTEYE